MIGKIQYLLGDILGIDNGEIDIKEADKKEGFSDIPYPDSDEDERGYPDSIPEPTQASTSTPFNSRRSPVGKGKMNNKVVGMPGLANSNSEVVVIEPQTFNDMPKVIQALRERKSVVLNLNIMNPEEAQRAVDFVAGGTFAMDGHQERVGESIFLFTPSCVKVSSLTEVMHDVQNPEAHVRRSAPVPEAWGEASAAAQ